MSTNSYTINSLAGFITDHPITGWTIRVGGPTFNQLIIEGYNYIDGRLVQRATPPPNYTTNPLTDRIIRVGGATFNRLVREAYDYIDGRLVRRVTASPIPEARPRYLNVETGRMVQYGTRTYDDLINWYGYEIINDYYLVPLRTEQLRQRERNNQQRETQLSKLADLNLTLCQECQMPVKLNELPENGLCEDCNREKQKTGN